MISIKVKTTVNYICDLTKSDEMKVKKYADYKGLLLNEAIQELLKSKEIDIFDGTVVEEECIIHEVELKEVYKD